MNKRKRGKYLNLTLDACFKAYFKESDKVSISLLKHFIPLLEGKEIKSVQFLDSIINTENPEDKDSLLDLRVHLDNGMSVNIEMQTASKENFEERILFYLSRLYTQNLKKGESYSNVCPAYSLVFTTFTVFKKLKDFYSLFQLKATNSEVVFSKYLGIVLVELNKFKEEDPSKIIDLRDMWCYLIKNAGSMGNKELKEISRRGGEMKQAVRRLERLSREESMELIEEAKEKARRDRIAEIAYGRNQGRIAEREEMVNKLIKEGLENSIIARVTGWTEQEVIAFKKKV